jgi:hypothetical protein
MQYADIASVYSRPVFLWFRYFYKIGHELLDGTVVWGKSYIFKAPPTPGQNSLQRIIVFGDMGKVLSRCLSSVCNIGNITARGYMLHSPCAALPLNR